MVFNYDASDPLAVVTAPPLNELPQDKAAREEREAEAQKISNQIDEEISADKVALKEKEQTVKILLLGQSESGESPVHSPSQRQPSDCWSTELTAMLLVPQENLPRSRVSDMISSTPVIADDVTDFRMRFARDKWIQERASWRTVIQLNLARSVNTILEALQQEIDNENEEDTIPLADEHHLLQVRLRPLRGVEHDLKRLLGAKPDEIQDSPPRTSPRVSPRASSEFFVRSWNWRDFLQASRNGDSSRRSPRHDVSSHDVTEVIAGCKDDIKALWEDNAIQEMLRRRRVRLEDSASLFVPRPLS
jgi:hypothetical protein